MNELAFIDLLGFWLGIFLTFCILSFLYKDNPFYKMAEHLFVGISIGYIVVQQYYNVIKPKLLTPFATHLQSHQWFEFVMVVIPLTLAGMMLLKLLSKRIAWVGRYPLALVVALYAGVQSIGVAQSDLGEQVRKGMIDIDRKKVNVNTASAKSLDALPGIATSEAKAIVEYRTREKSKQSGAVFDSLSDLAQVPGVNKDDWEAKEDKLAAVASTDEERIWFSLSADNIFSRLLLLLGLIASLVYFYYSIEHKGPVGVVSRFGVWVLMVGFGASFGFTVQGRIALAVGRVQNIRGDNVPPHLAEQINGPIVALISVAVIVVGIVVWERRERARSQARS